MAREVVLARAVIATLAVFAVTGCSASHQHVQPDGDVVLRSGTTPLGWAAIGIGLVFAVLLVGALFAVVALIVSESGSSLASGKYVVAAGWLVAIPVAVGFFALMEWGIASQTSLKYHTTSVTFSRARRELTVQRWRMIGNDQTHRWRYAEIAAIDFRYLPGTSGENSTPAQGVVYVRTAGQQRLKIFDGSPCAARDLSQAVSAAVGVSLHVQSGLRDISSYQNFFTQLRCGIQRPFHPASWHDYPAEAWRVLDLPFLWHWRWSVPILIGQLAIIAAVLWADEKWAAPQWSTLMRTAIWVAGAIAIAAMHVFATMSYGSWPAALALLALLAARPVGRRLRGAVASGEPD